MIEIEEPPDTTACAVYSVPLVWLWSKNAAKWKSYEPLDGDTDTIRRHRCERHGDPKPPWQQLSFTDEPDPDAVERARAGAARVRQELAAKETP